MTHTVECKNCGGLGYIVVGNYTGNPPEQESCPDCHWTGDILVVTTGLKARPGAESNKILSDGCEATLYQTITSGRILIGPLGDLGGDEEFMFNSFIEALSAFRTWDGYGQPHGWIRWKVGTATYRRDLDGKPISDASTRRQEEERIKPTLNPPSPGVITVNVNDDGPKYDAFTTIIKAVQGRSDRNPRR